MKSYSRSHLSDQELLDGLATLVARDRATTAELLAHIAEVDDRRLYRSAAYPSMLAYCVGELRLSEDSAGKRIHAARVARRFPAVFEAVAEGRLHLSAVVLLAPHLTEETVNDLLTAAADKSKSEIERFLAERFPKPDMLSWVVPIPPTSLPSRVEQHAPGRVVDQIHPGRVPTPATPSAGDRSSVKPLSAQSFALQVTIERSTHDKLQYLRDLLSHQIPSGNLAHVLDRALDLAIGQIEKRKFAATNRPSSHHRPTTSPRHIPAHVMIAVWKRDQGRCTFVSEAGRRCPARKRIEFDHVLEVALGGEATVDNIRLRCRAHNQYTAECTFGAKFMRHKRQATADARAAKARAATQARDLAAETARALAEVENDPERSVVPWLRALGFSLGDARRAAERSANMPEASVEQRVRAALSCTRPGSAHAVRVG